MNVDPELVGDGVPIGEGGCVEVREVKGEGEGEGGCVEVREVKGKGEGVYVEVREVKGEGEDDGGKRGGEGECVTDVLSPRPVHFSPMVTLQSFKAAVCTNVKEGLVLLRSNAAQHPNLSIILSTIILQVAVHVLGRGQLLHMIDPFITCSANRFKQRLPSLFLPHSTSFKKAVCSEQLLR